MLEFVLSKKRKEKERKRRTDENRTQENAHSFGIFRFGYVFGGRERKMKCRNFAHRGFSGKYPENTMIAFEKAIEAGCEGIEFDVHFSKDGQIVIIHDERIDRTSDQTGLVRDMTYEELCKVDFSYKFKGEVEFQRIPTLREYMELVKQKDIITNIELKTGVFEYPGIEQAVYDMIKEYGLEEKMLISSFNHYSIKRMKDIAPEIKCGLLTDTWILRPGEYTKNCGVEAYHPRFTMLTKEAVEDLKAHDVAINAWTINEQTDIDAMIDIGIDGIIGNYPDRVKESLKRKGLR